jgi:hypothetical protein
MANSKPVVVFLRLPFTYSFLSRKAGTEPISSSFGWKALAVAPEVSDFFHKKYSRYVAISQSRCPPIEHLLGGSAPGRRC